MLGELNDYEVNLVFYIVLSSLLTLSSLAAAAVGIMKFLLPSLAIDSLSDAISSNDVTF